MSRSRNTFLIVKTKKKNKPMLELLEVYKICSGFFSDRIPACTGIDCNFKKRHAIMKEISVLHFNTFIQNWALTFVHLCLTLSKQNQTSNTILTIFDLNYKYMRRLYMTTNSVMPNNTIWTFGSCAITILLSQAFANLVLNQ